jgi:hypothetical protein
MLSDKKIKKIEKILSAELTSEIGIMDPKALKAMIISSETSIKTAEEELEANPKYQELKENLKALSGGLRDIKKFQRARIDLALHILEEKGE